MKKKLNKGAATVIFLAIIALVLTLIMAATQSRLLLSLRRSQSATDSLIAMYTAESQVNDVMARLMGGYLESANIPKTTYNFDDIKIELQGQDMGETQTVTATVFRGFAVGQVQAVRRVQSVGVLSDVEIVMMLDCTGSMDEPSGTAGKTRLDAQEEAAIKFVEQMKNLPDSDKFKLGVGVFGVESAWMEHNGVQITPDSQLSFDEISQAIANGFSTYNLQSPECVKIDTRGTNVGIAYRHAHDYLAQSKAPGTKQIEIVITDGHPNSLLQDSQCPTSEDCIHELEGSRCTPLAINYLRCTLADSDTFISEINNEGVRDPDVDAYAVTIFPDPRGDVVSIFERYTTENGYFNASQANQLSGILEGILINIVEDRSTVSVKRIIPTPQ